MRTPNSSALAAWGPGKHVGIPSMPSPPVVVAPHLELDIDSPRPARTAEPTRAAWFPRATFSGALGKPTLLAVHLLHQDYHPLSCTRGSSYACIKNTHTCPFQDPVPVMFWPIWSLAHQEAGAYSISSSCVYNGATDYITDPGDYEKLIVGD